MGKSPAKSKGVAKGKGVASKGSVKGASMGATKGKGVTTGKGPAKGKGVATGKGPAKGKGVTPSKGKGKMKDATKGKGGAESAKQRVPRVAVAFAHCVPDLMPEEGSIQKEELRILFEEFCDGAGERSSGFSSILYKLVQWRVLYHQRKSRLKLPTTSQQIRNRKASPDLDLHDALVGKKPPSLGVEFANPVPPFHLPGEFRKLSKLQVYEMQQKTRELLDSKFEPKKLPEPENLKGRRDYLHSLLFAEELQMNFDISIYDLQLDEALTRKNTLHNIEVPGLAEKRPSVLKGDYLLLTCKDGKFKGYVHTVLMDSLDVSFHESFPNRPPFKVHFSFNRTPLRSMHRAIDDSSSIAAALESTKPITRPPPALLGNVQLNTEQRQFLAACCKPQLSTAPLLLWGPPGTGKTTTLVHTILELMKQQPKAKLLVTAPSNPASDLLCERISQWGVKSDKRLGAA